MIYLSSSDTLKQVFIPRHGGTPAAAPVLEAVNTVGNETASLPVEAWSVKGDYLCLSTKGAGLTPGEWRYMLVFTLADGSSVKYTGLLIVQEEETPEPVVYESEVIYKQYD